MLGGYQILDLTNIDLKITTNAEDITDSGVLKQLLNLREYIDENYNFTRPLNNKLKPLLIRLRDAEENEEIESSVWGNLSVTKDGFIISANVLQNPLLQFQLSVSFEKVYDDDSNAYWVIDDAKIMLSNSLNINGDLQAFEEITDKDGHKRFIEGNIVTTEAVEGLSFSYAKWSLSGTHLMFVLAGSIVNESVIQQGQILANATIPKWVWDKIYSVFASEVARQGVNFWATNYTTQQVAITLNKSSDEGKLWIISNALTANNDRTFRLQFDLLIDNE